VIDTDRNGTVSISSGVAGLDDVLRGGFRINRMYLLEGVPGSG
jgi:circadian clock protein KaiC